jgi:4-hydroxy-2-oxoglutarate aldolase
MRLTGVFAPLPTPFDEWDRVDVGRMRTAFPRFVASPLTGFIVLGTNGEAGLLDDVEADRVIDEARALTPDDRPLIAGTGRESTTAAVAAARRAASLGADAVLVRTPAFFKSQMGDDAFVRHYSAIADGVTVPVLLYNFTAATGVNLLPPTVARLANHPNIVGIKESGSDIAQIAELAELTPSGFAVLAGSATTFHAALAAGVSGGILALAAVAPGLCVRLFDAARSGQSDEARRLQRRLLPLSRLLSAHGVPALKAMLAGLGCDMGRPRLPLIPVDEHVTRAVREALATLEEVTA